MHGTSDPGLAAEDEQTIFSHSCYARSSKAASQSWTGSIRRTLKRSYSKLVAGGEGRASGGGGEQRMLGRRTQARQLEGVE